MPPVPETDQLAEYFYVAIQDAMAVAMKDEQSKSYQPCEWITNKFNDRNKNEKLQKKMDVVVGAPVRAPKVFPVLPGSEGFQYYRGPSELPNGSGHRRLRVD